MRDLRTLLRRFLADEPYRRLPDDDLWLRFRDHRDEAAFRVVLEKCGGRIYLRCRGLLGDDAAAEDAFQETFLALFRHRSKLPTYRAAVAWLYETATNKARQAVRTRQRAERRERQKAADAPTTAAPADGAELARWERHTALKATV